MQAALNRPRRTAEPSRRLLGGQAVEVAEEDRLPEPARQAIDLLEKLRARAPGGARVDTLGPESVRLGAPGPDGGRPLGGPGRRPGARPRRASGRAGPPIESPRPDGQGRGRWPGRRPPRHPGSQASAGNCGRPPARAGRAAPGRPAPPPPPRRRTAPAVARRRGRRPSRSGRARGGGRGSFPGAWLPLRCPVIWNFYPDTARPRGFCFRRFSHDRPAGVTALARTSPIVDPPDGAGRGRRRVDPFPFWSKDKPCRPSACRATQRPLSTI